MYRKCNDCGYSGEVMTFIQMTEIVSKSENHTSMLGHTHCPKCNSENICQDLYYDEEMTRPYKPPTISQDNAKELEP